jgi:hypothetical protein
MSPNIWLEMTDDGMLIATDGDRVNPVKTWTYSDFERFLDESITPSMYEFMANYVYNNLNKRALWEVEGDCYDGDYDEDAVNAYFELPWQERQKLHEQTLTNLEAEFERAREKTEAAKTFLAEGLPFDPTSPIYTEVRTYINELRHKNEEKMNDLERQIHEEECWRGGWEKGESDTEGPTYDGADEN